MVGKVTTRARGVRWGLTHRIEGIDFAVDMCIVSHSKRDLVHQLKSPDKEGKKVGLKINRGKQRHENKCKSQPIAGAKRQGHRDEELVYLGNV